jgi:hypothetical protein
VSDLSVADCMCHMISFIGGIDLCQSCWGCLHRQHKSKEPLPEDMIQPLLAALRAVAVLCWPPRSLASRQGLQQTPWNRDDIRLWLDTADNIAEVTPKLHPGTAPHSSAVSARTLAAEC